jgi:hypothetical protein
MVKEIHNKGLQIHPYLFSLEYIRNWWGTQLSLKPLASQYYIYLIISSEMIA